MISLLACESKAGRFNNPRDSYAYPLERSFVLTVLGNLPTQIRSFNKQACA